MAVLKIACKGTVLPEGVTELKASDELLWSEGTGRGADDGRLVGSVVARKQTWSVTWGVITGAQYRAIKAACPPGFFSVRIELHGTVVASFTAYRSNISGTPVAGAGEEMWKGVTLDLIER